VRKGHPDIQALPQRIFLNRHTKPIRAQIHSCVSRL
jgi:hypothetical protein